MLADEIDAFANPVPHDGIHRNGLDQPFVFDVDYKGPITFERGKTVPGRRGYARVTSFIDVLDSKDALDLYHQRLVLDGLVKQPHLLVSAREALNIGDRDDPQVKKMLNVIADDARKAADEGLKAAKGTAVHRWCEEADLALLSGMKPTEALAALSQAQHVDGYTFQVQSFQRDVAAYLEARRGLLKPVHVEQLHVNDELRVAGTPDRIDEWVGPPTLVPASGGSTIRSGDLIVTDIKTGSVEYSIGKFACQLGVYANSEMYDQMTNTRGSLLVQQPRKDYGLILHLPAGTGQIDLIWLDIAAGWDAVLEVATRVRAWRNDGKKLAAVHGKKATLEEMIHAALIVDQLRELWLNNQDSFTPALTGLAKARAGQLEAAKEAA